MPAPGSTVTTGIAFATSRPDAPPSATAFLAAPIGFGPTGWRPYRAMAEFLADYSSGYVFGGGTVGAVATSYFAEGGDLLYVNRMVGPDATAAELVLADRNDPAGDAIRFTAITVGAWGELLAITVEDGAGDTVDLTVELDPAVAGATSLSNVTITGLASATAMAAAVNAHPVLSSLLVATALNTGTDPADLPEQAEGEVLAGGDDDLEAPGAAIAGWTPPADLGPGVVIGPSLTDLAALTGDDLYQLAVDLVERRRILFTSSTYNDTLEDTSDDLAAVRDTLAQAVTDTLGGADTLTRVKATAELLSGFGVFWPWIGVDLEAAGVAPVPPVGVVAALRAKAITSEGPHRAPAGEAGSVTTGLGVTIWPGDGSPTGTITEELAAEADAAGLNVIRTIGGTVRVYGYKPIPLPPEFASLATAFPLLTERDTLNDVAAEADAIAERYVFRPIDPRGHVFAELRRDLLGLGERKAAQGSLYARIDPATRGQIDPGYAVDTGPEVNTTETIAAGQIKARMRVRVTPSGPFVDITVTKVALSGPT